MVWANAAVLGLGGMLLALPIILHFLMQPKPKVLEFPALQFVRKRQFANKSRMRLKHVVLLVLRCLLILLMAAALAGPSVASREFGQWVTLGGVGVSASVVALALLAVLLGSRKRFPVLVGVLAAILFAHIAYGTWASVKLLNSESAQLIGDSAAPVSAVILIDNSCRMGYQHENKTSLDRARELSRWLIEQFPADSQACVMATDGDAPFYSVDAGAARNRIGNLEIEFADVTIPSRLSSALKLLDEAIHERKEIYIVSDLTRKSWQYSESTIATEIELDSSLSVFVLDVGQEDVANFELTPLSIKRESITKNGQIEISTNVTRIGASAQRNVRFRLERPDNTRPVIRDRKVLVPEQFIERSKTVDVRQDSSTAVNFKFSERLGLGVHHGYVEIVGDDSLTYDDRRYFTIEVRDTWNVLVVHGDDVTPDNLTEALADDGENSLFNCTVVAQNELPGNLENYQAVFFLDPESGISETTWSTLRQYVASGHGLGFWLGPNAADGAFGHPSFQSEGAQKILTGKLDRQWRRPDADLFLSPDNLAHPVFAPFREWETSVRWSKFPVFMHWSILADQNREQFPTQTILRYGNGMPAIIERQIEDGRVLVMTTPITEAARMDGRDSWNSLFVDFPLPAWLLVRQMSEYLVQSQADRLNFEIGETVRLKNDFRKYPKDYRIFTPRTNRTPEQISSSEGVVRYRFTNSPGQYRLKGKLNAPVLRGFSVNLDAGQTDLTRVLPEDIDNVLGAGHYQLATKRDQLQRQQGATRRGQEFYPLLLLMLIVVMSVEYLMSNRFYS